MSGTKMIDGLSPMELAFAEAFVALGESTCGNATKSAEAAGFHGEHRVAGCKVLSRLPVRKKIQELHRATMDKFLISPERVLSDLEDLRLRCLEKQPPDFATAFRCSEAHGRYMAMFTDRVALDVGSPPRLPEETRLEAKRIARLALADQGQLPPPAAIDGQGANQ